MAKKKKEPVSTATTGRARDLGIVKLLQAEVDPRLDKAVEECAAHERRKKKVVIIAALEEYLKKAGFWPPGTRPPGTAPEEG
jgi:L-lactate utilization protein LutC